MLRFRCFQCFDFGFAALILRRLLLVLLYGLAQLLLRSVRAQSLGRDLQLLLVLLNLLQSVALHLERIVLVAVVDVMELARPAVRLEGVDAGVKALLFTHLARCLEALRVLGLEPFQAVEARLEHSHLILSSGNPGSNSGRHGHLLLAEVQVGQSTLPGDLEDLLPSCPMLIHKGVGCLALLHQLLDLLVQAIALFLGSALSEPIQCKAPSHLLFYLNLELIRLVLSLQSLLLLRLLGSKLVLGFRLQILDLLQAGLELLAILLNLLQGFRPPQSLVVLHGQFLEDRIKPQQTLSQLLSECL
mmetsp:Transcript_4281/g.6361  ORF Transcript_4281/g.6361 Transcript_4281/m.6361 type:complete len:302 (-) Transcript_4281:3601-4506(-)